MKVTIFGGASPRSGDPAYEEAYKLGSLLGKNKHIILTGGYMGTMEAASHGAFDAGAHVIGVTCEEIERWRPQGPNAWVKEEWRCKTLQERLQRLIHDCDAAVALPGGAGTLAEIALQWNQLIIRAVSPRLLILVGSSWARVFSQLIECQGTYISDADRQWLHFSPDVDHAAEKINGIGV